MPGFFFPSTLNSLSIKWKLKVSCKFEKSLFNASLPQLPLPTHISPFPRASSLRLAYKDLEEQRKRGEEKMKGMEGKKKEQAERLGMGFGSRR